MSHPTQLLVLLLVAWAAAAMAEAPAAVMTAKGRGSGPRQATSAAAAAAANQGGNATVQQLVQLFGRKATLPARHLQQQPAAATPTAQTGTNLSNSSSSDPTNAPASSPVAAQTAASDVLDLADDIAYQISRDVSTNTTAGSSSASSSDGESASDDIRGVIVQQLMPTIAAEAANATADGNFPSSSSMTDDAATVGSPPPSSLTAASLAADAVARTRETFTDPVAAAAEAVAVANASAGINQTEITSKRQVPFPASSRGQLPEDIAGLTVPGPQVPALSSRSALQVLLDTISNRWQELRQMGRERSGTDGNTSRAMATWQGLLTDLQQQQPELAAFARLASLNPLMQRVVSRMGVPVAVLPPTNAELAKHLKERVLGNTSSVANSTWVELVDMAAARPGSSIMLLLRHIVPVRQHQIVDPDGSLVDHLFAEGSPGDRSSYGPAGVKLLTHSVVLQTGMGSYIQVSDFPADSDAFRLQATAEGVALQNGSSNGTLAAEALASAAILEGQNASDSNSSTNTTAVLRQRLSRLSFGDLRALSEPFNVGNSKVLVIPISGVLEDRDEVINGRTAARLRGAFGWKPEDEHALLSRVYLDPYSTYWAKTLQIIEYQNRTQQDSSESEGRDTELTESAAASSSNASSRNMTEPGGRKLAQIDTSSGGDSSSIAGSSSGSSSSPAPSPVPVAASNTESGSSSVTSGSSSGHTAADISSVLVASPGVAGSSSTGGAALEAAAAAAPSPAAPTNTTAVTLPPAVPPAAAPASSNGSSIPSMIPASATTSPGVAASTTPSVSNSSNVIPAPAELAELLARQQDQLLQIHMADALAANLMTYEALSSWTTAAVSDPAIVFSMRRQQQQSGAQAASSSSSSALWTGSSNNGQLEPCFVDWKGLGSFHFGIGCCNASSSTTVFAGVQHGSLSSSLAEFLTSSNNTSSNGSCQLAWATLATADQQQQSQAQPDTSSLELSGLLSGPSGVPGCSSCATAGTVSTAALVGLSPYQLYPALSTAGGDASSVAARNLAQAAAVQQQQAITSSTVGDDTSAQNLRGLKQSVASTASSAAAEAAQIGGAVSNASTSNASTSSSNSSVSTPTTATASSAAVDAAGIYVRVNADQIAYFSVLQLAELMADGQVTPQQLTAVYTNRLNRYDSLLHPVVTLTTELAGQQAAAAQQAITASNASAGSNNSRSSSLLTGIPYGLKDLFSVPGYPTTWGLAQLRNRTIDTPCWAFSALSSAAGGVLLAKTATGELAWGDVWFDDITTRNPWNVNTGSCGSSAGSAVAVVAGLLPYAVGTETWGSIVCPASTVGATAYRPTGGTIAGHGAMQVSSSLDKSGVFCRQVLDCAVIADALMDTTAAAAAPMNNNTTTPNAQQKQQPRLHRQDAKAAAAFNYSDYQAKLTPQQAQQQHNASQWDNALLPPTFQQLPSLATLCIGYLRGTSTTLIQALRRQKPQCVKGPLRPPGNNHMVQDVLSVILQSEVAVNMEGLWLEGFINTASHWYPLIQLGQVAPAAAYLKAQRLRAVLLAQVKHYFAVNGISVLLKPSKSEVGTDGLAALLDMPEVLLPVGFTLTAADKELRSSSGRNDTFDSGSVAAARLQQHLQMQQQQQQQQAGQGVDSATDADLLEQVWLQPEVNSIIALPGADAAVVAVGAAFQSVTDYHTVHPILA